MVDSGSAVRSRRRSAVFAGVVAFVATFALYAATCARGVEWQDSGFHQYRVMAGWVESPFGLATSHPLHQYLGRALVAFPVGDPLFKLNLLSAFCGAVGVGVLAGALVSLSGSVLAAGFAAAALALSHSYWQMSALTETYTLAAALMTIEWACLLAYLRTGRPVWLVAVFAVNGLHIADHLLGLLTLPTYVVFALDRLFRRRIRPAWLLLAAAVWVVGTSPYLMLCIGHFQRTGDLALTLHRAFFGGAGPHSGWQSEVLNTRISAAHAKLVVLTYGYCFPSATAVIALLGVFRKMRGRRRPLWWVMIAQTFIIFVFVGRYNIRDLYTFFVPVCVVTAFWFGLGAASLLRRWRSGISRRVLLALLLVNALLPVAVYVVFPQVARERGWLRSQMSDIPFRDEYNTFFRPWRCFDHSAALFARAALERLQPGDWLIAGATDSPAVALTHRLEGGPPDTEVFLYARCLTDTTRPLNTIDDVRAHLRSGRRILLRPVVGTTQLVPSEAVLDRSSYLWEIRAPQPASGPSGTGEASSRS
jgi:hypothetical protein